MNWQQQPYSGARCSFITFLSSAQLFLFSQVRVNGLRPILIGIKEISLSWYHISIHFPSCPPYAPPGPVLFLSTALFLTLLYFSISSSIFRPPTYAWLPSTSQLSSPLLCFLPSPYSSSFLSDRSKTETRWGKRRWARSHFINHSLIIHQQLFSVLLLCLH